MLFLVVGLILTGQAILTPILMVIIMLTGDLLGMSLTTDNVEPSKTPNAWRISELTIEGVFVGISELVYCTAILIIGKSYLQYGIGELRTLAFVAIVFGNQATNYVNRQRQQVRFSRPSVWVLGSSIIDIVIASVLATFGIAMSPLSMSMVGAILTFAVIFAFIMNLIKVPMIRRLQFSQRKNRDS